jgi:hypothetical protein
MNEKTSNNTFQVGLGVFFWYIYLLRALPTHLRKSWHILIPNCANEDFEKCRGYKYKER